MSEDNDNRDDERVRLHVRRILERFIAGQRQKNSAATSDIDREENRPVRVRDSEDPT